MWCAACRDRLNIVKLLLLEEDTSGCVISQFFRGSTLRVTRQAQTRLSTCLVTPSATAASVRYGHHTPKPQRCYNCRPVCHFFTGVSSISSDTSHSAKASVHPRSCVASDDGLVHLQMEFEAHLKAGGYVPLLKARRMWQQKRRILCARRGLGCKPSLRTNAHCSARMSSTNKEHRIHSRSILVQFTS